MSDQLAHNLNTSTNMSTSSINCVEVNLFDNNVLDDGLVSCSLEGSIGVDNNDKSLHDIFQHLSQVPLHATTATLAPISTPTPTPAPLPTPPGPSHHRLEEDHSRVVAHDYQTVICGKKWYCTPLGKANFHNVLFINHKHSSWSKFTRSSSWRDFSKSKWNRDEGIDWRHNGQPLRCARTHILDLNKGRKFKDIDVDVVKGHTKGKQPLEREQADNQHGSSKAQALKKNSQRRNSEHKRRERINAKMRTIQALVPTCDKGDHASILDHAIKYIKYLKLQIDIMSRSIGQSQLQNLYAAQMMMHPTMVPGIGYGPWQSQMSPSSYPLIVIPPGDGGVPIQPIPQVQAQAHSPFSPILSPSQYLPTTITSPPTPTVLSYVPPLPQFTPPNSSDEPPYFQPPNS